MQQGTRSFSDMLIDFIDSFINLSKHSSIPKFELIEANMIPPWISVDWKIYEDIMCPILLYTNKSTNKTGKVTIKVSYHEF